jgi:bifunctional non-homologous end joining protein LigD
MPGFIRPQLATLKAKAPKGAQYIHEIKFDSCRVQVHVNAGKKKVYIRNGLDWTKRFSVIAGSFDVSIDGEVVVVHERRTNFSELQAELAAGRQDRLIYYAFDLLWRDGDMRRMPQIERKQALLDLLRENDIGPPVVYSDHLTGDGQELFKHASKLNFEGIISKRIDAPYSSERGEAWLKIKTVHKGKFPVIGFIKDPSGIAALYLGKQEGKDLVYMGKVGRGWNRTTSSEIRKALDTVVSPKSKLSKPLKNQRRHGWSPLFLPIEYRASPLKVCSGPARSRGYPEEQGDLGRVYPDSNPPRRKACFLNPSSSPARSYWPPRRLRKPARRVRRALQATLQANRCRTAPSLQRDRAPQSSLLDIKRIKPAPAIRRALPVSSQRQRVLAQAVHPTARLSAKKAGHWNG